MFCSLIKAESENVHVVFCPNKECPFEPLCVWILKHWPVPATTLYYLYQQRLCGYSVYMILM